MAKKRKSTRKSVKRRTVRRKTKIMKARKVIKRKVEQDPSKLYKEIIKEHAKKRMQIKEKSNTHKKIKSTKKREEQKKEYIKTGIKGVDSLFEKGIPKGASLLIAGGTGSGKTIFCLQMLNYAANNGEKCLFMSFEESEEHLRQHMEDFGWKPRELEKKGLLKIQRFNPFDITRSVDALLAKAKGELLIDIEPILLPDNFKPDRIVVDSLSAIAAAFVGKEESYRIYIEQLFRFFEKLEATVFLITETEQIPTTFSRSGVEEFLADGVIVLYNIRRGNIRENAIEVLKLRGAKHEKRIVAMQILSGVGIEVYPQQEVYGGIEKRIESPF